MPPNTVKEISKKKGSVDPELIVIEEKSHEKHKKSGKKTEISIFTIFFSSFFFSFPE